MADKPNILYIYPDQHRGDTMGCAGNPAARTPNIDTLAAEGVTFSRCHTNSPLCMPARASMMNGLYVNEHGVWNNSVVADRKGQSHVRNIRDAGYHTAVVGKTHLYVHGGAVHTNRHIDELNEWGFEHTHELTGPLASFRLGSPYTDYLEEKGLLELHRQGIRTYIEGMRRRLLHPWEEPPSYLPVEDHLDAYTGRVAADWIRNYSGERPFYLQVLFPGPHDPFDSPAEHRARCNPEDIPLAIMDRPQPPVSPLVERILRMSRLDDMTESRNRVMRSYYYGKVALIDDGVGLILQALQDRGLLDNTWVIYGSDHGEMVGDHRLSHKMVFYEGAVNIPCIFRPPGGVKGWTSWALTGQIDVTATLLDIAGAAPLPGSDSRSLLPQVQAGPGAPGADAGKEVILSEVFGFSMVRTERYKMCVDARTREPVELYDMETDPQELHNLVQEPSLEHVRRELLDRHFSRLLGKLDGDKLDRYEETQAARARGGVYG